MVRRGCRSNSRKCIRANTMIYISDIKKYIPATIELTKYTDDLGTHNNFKDPKEDNIQLAVDGKMGHRK